MSLIKILSQNLEIVYVILQVMVLVQDMNYNYINCQPTLKYARRHTIIV